MAKRITVCSLKVPAWNVNLESYTSTMGSERGRSAQISAATAKKLAAFVGAPLPKKPGSSVTLCDDTRLANHGSYGRGRKVFTIERVNPSEPFAGAKRKSRRRR